MATLRADLSGVNPGYGTRCADRGGLYYMTGRLVDALYNGRRRDFDNWCLELRKSGLYIELGPASYETAGDPS